LRQYLDIVNNILNHGLHKQPTRDDVPVENATIGLPNLFFSHNMEDGFPLLTTRKVPWRNIRVELEGFIKGITSKKWYQDRKCIYWDHWGNPKKVREQLKIDMAKPSWSPGQCDKEDLEKAVKLLEDDLGPIYGYQGRRFNQAYDEDDHGWVDESQAKDADQILSIVKTLKHNPYDRRMVCSYWNPLQKKIMALPPCHFAWAVTVYGDTLNLAWVQRSVDTYKGLPSNIASYGLLLELLAHTSGFKAGNLSALLIDCHLYQNDISAARQLVERKPRDLPSIRFTDGFDSVFNWEWNMAKVDNYNPDEPLKGGKITV
jgi:thymidylate synthase